MKKIAFVALGLILLVASPSVQAGQIVADSRIVDVTVFNDRAMVKRVAAVKLERGENVVTFDGLPLLIAEESLRAEGKGAAVARISGLAVRNIFLENSSQKRLRDIEVEIQALERSVQKIEARRSALAAQKAFIDSIRVGWGERISKELSLGKPSSAELSEANRFVGESILKIEDSSFDTVAEKKPLLDRIAALKKQLADISSDRRKEVRSVDLTIDAPLPMELNVELYYIVSQARWEPVYDIRLSPDGKSAELLYRAIVSQGSGEDWKGVNLSLSTATPSVGSAPPELKPWNIFFREPPGVVMREARAMKKSAAAPAPMALEADSGWAEYGGHEPVAEFMQATHQASQVSEQQNSVLFVIPKAVDIPADGSRQSSQIATARIPVKAEFVTVPKLSPAVFLKSEVTNLTAYPLLAGAVSVFNDTAFVGKSYLKNVAPGEKFDLFFGSDSSVKVKRSAAKLRKEAGLLAGNSVSWKITVELENFRREEVGLTMIDQIPVAGNEEVKVALRSSEPAVSESKSDGRQLWNLNLKPGEKRTVTYQIDVEYPKGREIVGVE